MSRSSIASVREFMYAFKALGASLRKFTHRRVLGLGVQGGVPLQVCEHHGRGAGEGDPRPSCADGEGEPLEASRLEVLNERRNVFLMATEEKGVSTRQGTHAVHGLGYYREKYGYDPLDCPQSLLAEGLSITLPLYPQMTDEEQDYVVDVLRACYAAL